MAGESAGPAAEDGLALARPSIDRPARAATLRRERWVDPLDTPRSLLLKSAFQETPARGKNLPVQAGLPGHASAGRLECALGGAGHVADVQLLDTEQPSLAPGTRPRSSQQLAREKRRARGHASVQAHNLARSWTGDVARDYSERDVPAAGTIEFHSVRPHAAWYRPRPSKPDPADPRDPDRPGTSVQPADVFRSDRDNPKSLTAPGFAPSRPAMRALEEASHGPGKVPQCLLLDYLASMAQPVMLAARRSELPALLHISRRARPASTPPGLLFDGQVPYNPRLGTVAFKDYLLGRRGTQPIPAHTNTVSRSSDIPGTLKRPLAGALRNRKARLTSV